MLFPTLQVGVVRFSTSESSLLLRVLPSSAHLSAQLQLTPSYWRRRDPPVSLRIPQLSSPLSSAPARTFLLATTGSTSVPQNPPAQLTSQLSSSSPVSSRNPLSCLIPTLQVGVVRFSSVSIRLLSSSPPHPPPPPPHLPPPPPPPSGDGGSPQYASVSINIKPSKE